MTKTQLPSSDESDGFTLFEVLISLVLFALISLAGISLVQTVVDVQTRTEVRGDRLAQIQRALYLLGADFEQMTERPMIRDDTVQIMRSGAAGEYPVGYSFAEGAVRRSSGENSAVVLDGVQGLAIRVFVDGQWVPIPEDTADQPLPRAIEITLAVAPRPNAPSGPVRRVIELPVLAP